MKQQENIDLNPQYAEYLKRYDGMVLLDNRKDQKMGLSEEAIKKIRDHFSKNYGKNAPADEYLLNRPYTAITITNNPHTYAHFMCMQSFNGVIEVEDIEGKTQNGELGYAYEHEKCPNFEMSTVQVSVIGQPDSSGLFDEKKLNIYIPDPEKEEVGEYIKKYEKAFIEENKDILYSDNVVEREAEKIDMSNFEIEYELEEKDNSISIDRLDNFSQNASRKKVNEFLDEAIKEMNSQDREK